MEDRLGSSLGEDISAHDEHAIRSEADLLEFSPESLQWLAEQLGPDYVRRWHPKMAPKEVADWMHILRTQLVADDQSLQQAETRSQAGPLVALGKPQSEAIDVTELVGQAVKTVPELTKIPVETAHVLVRTVFKQIGQKIDSVGDGVVRVPGLGQFRIKQVEEDKDGSKQIIKRVAFRVVKQ
jgi:hypothetical protein